MFSDEIRKSFRNKNIRRSAAARITFAQRVREQAEQELKDMVHFHDTPHRESSRRFGLRLANRYSQRARDYYENEVEPQASAAPDWYHEETIDVKLKELSSALRNAVDYLVYDNVIGIDLNGILQRLLAINLTEDDYSLLEPILTTVDAILQAADADDSDSAVAYAYEAIELIAEFLGENEEVVEEEQEVEAPRDTDFSDVPFLGDEGLIQDDPNFEEDEAEEWWGDFSEEDLSESISEIEEVDF